MGGVVAGGGVEVVLSPAGQLAGTVLDERGDGVALNGEAIAAPSWMALGTGATTVGYNDENGTAVWRAFRSATSSAEWRW